MSMMDEWMEEIKRKRGRKRVLARLKKPGRPLKTIRLMKYVKAHKETARPFTETGGGRLCRGRVRHRKLGKYAASAKIVKLAKAPVDTH